MFRTCLGDLDWVSRHPHLVTALPDEPYDSRRALKLVVICPIGREAGRL
jgi:hypothetical protein